MTDLDVRLLKVFRTIVANGGLKGAAKALNVGLPTISKQLSDLEIRLGIRLCIRGSSKFELTPDGSEVYRASTELFSSIEIFRNDVNRIKKKKELLRIAVIDNIITDENSPLPWLISYFDARDCHVSVLVSKPEEIEKGICGNIFDIGITPIYHRNPDLQYSSLYNEISYLYCGRLHPFFANRDEELDSQTVDSAPCVEHLYVDRRFIPTLKNKSSEGPSALQLDAVLTLVLSGNYLGFLPGHFAAAFEDRQQIRKVHPERHQYSTEIGFIHRQESVLNSTTLQAIGLLRNRCIPEGKPF